MSPTHGLSKGFIGRRGSSPDKPSQFGVAGIDSNGNVRDADGNVLIREPAVANSLKVYVSPNGSDANDGLTEATPKLTVQAAINTLPSQGTPPYGTVPMRFGTVVLLGGNHVVNSRFATLANIEYFASSQTVTVSPADVATLGTWMVGAQLLRGDFAGLTITSVNTTAGTFTLSGFPQFDAPTTGVTGCTWTFGQNTIQATGNVSNVIPGMICQSGSFPANTTVLSVNTSTKVVTLSANATAAQASGVTVNFQGAQAFVSLPGVSVPPGTYLVGQGRPASFVGRGILFNNTISSITVGATTTLTLGSHSLSVGQAVIVRGVGGNLGTALNNIWTILSVTSTTVTVGVNTNGLTGSTTGATANGCLQAATAIIDQGSGITVQFQPGTGTAGSISNGTTVSNGVKDMAVYGNYQTVAGLFAENESDWHVWNSVFSYHRYWGGVLNINAPVAASIYDSWFQMNGLVTDTGVGPFGANSGGLYISGDPNLISMVNCRCSFNFGSGIACHSGTANFYGVVASHNLSTMRPDTNPLAVTAVTVVTGVATLTVPSHGLFAGQAITLQNFSSPYGALNGNFYAHTTPTGSTFTVLVNTTGMTGYAGGGTMLTTTVGTGFEILGGLASLDGCWAEGNDFTNYRIGDTTHMHGCLGDGDQNSLYNVYGGLNALSLDSCRFVNALFGYSCYSTVKNAVPSWKNCVCVDSLGWIKTLGNIQVPASAAAGAGFAESIATAPDQGIGVTTVSTATLTSSNGWQNTLGCNVVLYVDATYVAGGSVQVLCDAPLVKPPVLSPGTVLRQAADQDIITVYVPSNWNAKLVTTNATLTAATAYPL